jgi:hypothetical protein
VSQRAVDRWILVELWVVHQSFVGAAVRRWVVLVDYNFDLTAGADKTRAIAGLEMMII